MNTSVQLRRWVSRSRPATAGFELLGKRIDAHHVDAALDSSLVGSDVRNSVFLLVRIAASGHDGIAAAIGQASKFPVSTRICLAVDRSTLELVDAKRLDTTRVGILLDGVTVEISPADVIHEAIEAIRFDATFVARSARDLRARCALHSMVALAGSLGLATLGPSTMGSPALFESRLGFDFTDEDSDEAEGPESVTPCQDMNPAKGAPGRYPMSVDTVRGNGTLRSSR